MRTLNSVPIPSVFGVAVSELCGHLSSILMYELWYVFVFFNKCLGFRNKIDYAYRSLHTTNLPCFMCRGAVVSEIHGFNQKKKKRKMMMKDSKIGPYHSTNKCFFT